ncbi:MAG: alpha/beta hydrolase [Microthrixaceae bacterium]
MKTTLGRTTRRHPLRLLSVILALMLGLSACVVSPPSGDVDRVPLLWPAAGEPAAVDVQYGADPANVADIYTPQAGGNLGVIILVHGGAFTSGDRSEVKRMSGVIMSQLNRGYSVVNIEYRLTTASTNHFPAAVDDVSAAVRWVRENGADYGMNPETVIVAGHSAGGTLAALVGVGWNSSPSGALGTTAKVDGYISFAGILDFPNAAPITAFLGRSWLGAHADTPGWSQAASATSHLDPADPPGYLAQGDLDTYVEMNQVNLMAGSLLRSQTSYAKLFVDRVVTGDDTCRWHIPQCGVNATELNRWIDLVQQRRF